jgi:hypothetical protein
MGGGAELNPSRPNSRRSHAEDSAKPRSMQGRSRFGETESGATTDCVGDPRNVTASFGLNSPNESFSTAGRGVAGSTGKLVSKTVGVAPFGSIGTCYGVLSRNTEIGYFSPTFGGFTFGRMGAMFSAARNLKSLAGRMTHV